MEHERKEFLLKMYDQMFNDINTHTLVVWQSVGVVVGAFAVCALVEKNIIPMDYACHPDGYAVRVAVRQFVRRFLLVQPQSGHHRQY
jgi:hypothetical protein